MSHIALSIERLKRNLFIRTLKAGGINLFNTARFINIDRYINSLDTGIYIIHIKDAMYLKVDDVFMFLREI